MKLKVSNVHIIQINLRICLIICLVSFLFSGCGKQTYPQDEQVPAARGSSDRYVIGFSNGFSLNSWRAEMLSSLRLEAAKHEDVELIVLDGPGDINKQVADIESFIARRVDAIILIPNSSQAVTPVLKRAMSLGIKVINFNLPLEDPDSYDVYVGPDETERGQALAEWLTDKLEGKGNIIMFGGLPGNPGTSRAIEGALEVFQSTDINILAYRDAYWQEDRARTIMTELISKYPDIDGIWSDGGQVSAGALHALIDAGRPPVPVTGDDYNGLFKIYMDYHEDYPDFDFATISTPTWQSKLAFQVAVRLLKGEEVEKWVKIESRMINGRDAALYARPDFSDSIFLDTDLPDEVLREIQ